MTKSGKSLKLTWFFYLFGLLALIFLFARLEKKSDENKVLFQKKFANFILHGSIPGPGSLYVRWGRRYCPRSARFVYNGYAAGQYHNDTGGGSNILCLPRFPKWATKTSFTENYGSIYGIEYQLSSYSSLGPNGLFSTPNSTKLNHRVVPCALCLTRGPATVMVIPGRSKCYPGWFREYSGYLMTAYKGHKGRSKHVCVDRYAQRAFLIPENHHQALLHYVEATCGALPCPPYCDGFELTCVVCSQCP